MNIQEQERLFEQIKSLKTGKGIQHLLNAGYDILNNPILAHDMDYKLISFTEGIVTDDPIWNEFISNGCVSLDRIEFYKNEDFLDTVASAPKITYLRSNKLPYDRIFAKLFNVDRIQIGCAVILEAGRPFVDVDLQLFELFCDKLNREIAMSEYFKKYGQEYQEILINELIKGTIKDKEIFTAHVESLYINLKSHLNLVVVGFGEYEPPTNKLSYIRDLLKRARPDFKYAVVNNNIVVLTSTEEQQKNIAKELKKFNKILEKYNMAAGISGGFENLFDLKKYYEMAVTALNYGIKHSGAKQIFLCDEMK